MRALDGNHAACSSGGADPVVRSELMSWLDTGGWILVVAGVLIGMWGEWLGLL